MSFWEKAAAPISGIFDLGTSILNRHYRRKEETGRRKYEQARELDRRAYDQAMWDKVNKYNHPLAQMQRLTDAGLNPNLIYGSSPGSAVGNAQSIASGKQLQGQAPQYQMSNPITSFMNTKVQQAQSNNLKADAQLKTAQAIKAGKDAGISGVTLDWMERTLEPRVAAAHVDLEIKEIKRNLDRDIAPHKIANEMAMARKNDLAADLIQGDLDNRAQGYFKGDPVTTLMKGVFNLDLSNPDDRVLAQIVATAALTSHLVGNMAGALRQGLQALKLAKKK